MHEQRDHINVYKCYMCGTFVKSRSELKLHYEYHVEKTHDCLYCEMTFLKDNELHKHLKAHPKIFKEENVGRILESYTYIEKKEKAPTISGGKLKIYERIQRTCPIKRSGLNMYSQRIGGGARIVSSINDRVGDKLLEVPLYPNIIPETFWEQRTKQNLMQPEINGSEHSDGNETSEIVVPDYDGEFDQCSNMESENNNSIRLEDEVSENCEQTKNTSFQRLEEHNFFSTEDLNTNSRCSRSSSTDQELNGIFSECDGVQPMENEEDINSLVNNSLSPSTSRKNDVLESHAKKYTINKRLKRKFLYQIRTKEMRIINSPIPSYNELVHRSCKGFKIAPQKSNYINGPWRLTNDNIKNV